MKTPRDILLAQHRAAEAKLDNIRNEFVAGFREGRRVAVPKFRVADTATLPILIWRELIFPSRRIWAGLAAVWVLLFAVNFFLRDHSPAGAMKNSPPATMMTFQQQERLLAELDKPIGFHPVEPPKKFAPRPRSERIEIWAV